MPAAGGLFKGDIGIARSERRSIFCNLDRPAIEHLHRQVPAIEGERRMVRFEPIIKDRLFFLSNYEGFKLRNQAQQLYSVPSAAMRTGNFSELLPKLAITDPTNKNLPFNGNIIPGPRLNPVSVGLLEFYPLPNIAGAGLVKINATADSACSGLLVKELRNLLYSQLSSNAASTLPDASRMA